MCMRVRACCGVVSFAALLAAVGCSSSPAAPAVLTVAPQQLTPANGSQIANQTLPVTKDYYWRARAQAPGGVGSFSDLFKFTIGSAITLAAPAPIGPLTNAETTPLPALRVSNASRSRSTGAITYKFEIARDSGFNAIVMTGTNTEGINETGFIPPSELPTRVPLFWRA